MASTYTKSNKTKKGGRSRNSSFIDTWWWCLIVPKRNLKKRRSQIVLRLGDSAHLHLETTKQKEKKGESKFPLCRDLAMVATCTQKKKKTRKRKKRRSSFPSTKTWPWCPRSNKKNEKRESKLPFCWILAMVS